MSQPKNKEAKIPEFVYKKGSFCVTSDMLQAFEEHGIFVVRNLISRQEISRITNELEHTSFRDETWNLADGRGKTMRMLLWSHPGSDVLGMVARSKKVVKTCEELLGGEVYHYHAKIMMKEAKSGGRVLWHQDYGYWYKNGCLKPDMMTVFIPFDPCRKENGCLQVILGSHRCGRIDHKMAAGQTSADNSQINQILDSKKFPLVCAKVEAGDALFFHSNILHKSDANESGLRRWCYAIAYNKKDNNPVIPHHCPFYTPLSVVDDDMIMKCKPGIDFKEKDIMDPKQDKTIRLDYEEEK